MNDKEITKLICRLKQAKSQMPEWKKTRLERINNWSFDGQTYEYHGTGNRSTTWMGSYIFVKQ